MNRLDSSFEYFDSKRVNDNYNFITTIWISSDGCSVSGYSCLDKEYIYLSSFPDTRLNIHQIFIPKFEEIISSENINKIISLSDRVRVVLDETRFSLVPKTIMDESKKTKLYTLTNDLNPFEKLISKSIDSIDQFVIYPINDVLLEYLKEKFSDKLEIVSYSEALLKLQSDFPERDSIFANVNGQSITITIKKDKTIRFHNTFEYRSTEDAIYFLIYSLEQEQMDSKDSLVYVSGNSIQEDSELFQQCSKYVRELKPIQVDKFNSIFFKLKLAETHRFPYLFSL